MERALRYELGQLFPGTRIFPTSAPVDSKAPYLIYLRHSTDWDKSLDGFIEGEALNYIVNGFAETYDSALDMRESFEELLRRMFKACIGANADVYINDIDLNGVGEVYEDKLKLHRWIVDFTVYI